MADCQLCENFYPEIIESQQGKSQMALYPTPGLAIFCTLPEIPRLNGGLAINGRMFQVAGKSVYELFANGTFVNRFTIANDGKPVSMAAAQPIAGQGTPQLAIVSAGSLYVMNLLTNAVTIPAGLQGTPLQIVYVDGYYFLLNTSGVWQVSIGLDATNWPGIETEATTSYPDQTIGIGSVHREFFTFSALKGTAYYNAGDNPIPFDEVSGGDFEQGTVSPWSIVPLDNTLFFIGQNKEGGGIAWRLSGYTPTRISTFGIEFAWQGYSTISDVVCYGYQDQGHTFYVCYFPTANKTWVYDVASGKWHRRSFWNSQTAQRTAHRSCSHAYCFGMHLVGDWASGNVYQMSISQTMDFGNVIQRKRRAPHISNESERIVYHQFQILMETGLTPSQLLQGNAVPTVYVLTDALGNIWNFGINDQGAFTGSAAAEASSIVLYLNDPLGLTSWQVVPVFVSPTSCIFDAVEVPLNPAYPTSIVMISSTGQTKFVVNVTSLGILQSTFAATNYRNPTMLMRYSNDEGRTWSNYRPCDTGAPGNYKARVIFRRLGQGRDRVFEIVVTDPIPWRIVDAYVKATPGYEASERLTDRARKVA